VADGSHLWSNLQDMLGDCTRRLVRGVCFIADGKDAQEASVGLTLGNIFPDVILYARNTEITFTFLINLCIFLMQIQNAGSRTDTHE